MALLIVRGVEALLEAAAAHVAAAAAAAAAAASRAPVAVSQVEGRLLSRISKEKGKTLKKHCIDMSR